MNPFDLTGPEFLALYIPLAIVVLVAAGTLRWVMRKPVGEPYDDDLDLTPYEVAHLAGGAPMVVNAALAKLVHQNLVVVDATASKLSARGELRADRVDPVEKAVRKVVESGAGDSVGTVHKAAAAVIPNLDERLRERGLLVAPPQAVLARWLPFTLIVAVVLFGVVKINVGLSRDRPVGFLVAACVGTALIGALIAVRAVHRSRRGDAALARLKEDNTALSSSLRGGTEQLAGADLALGVGLFGLAVITAGPLADLRTVLKPPSEGSGSSCGSGCGGGGGCGGGCGGGGCGGCGG